jgi:hypothetical protein
MSQAAQLITLGSAGVEPIPENSSDDTSATPPASAGCPSNQSAQRSAKRPRNDTEVPTGSNRSFQSNQGENEFPQIDHVAQQAEVGNMPPRALQGHAGSFTPGPEVDMGFNGDWLTSEGPWSSTMLRFTGPQQQQPRYPLTKCLAFLLRQAIWVRNSKRPPGQRWAGTSTHSTKNGSTFLNFPT